MNIGTGISLVAQNSQNSQYSRFYLKYDCSTCWNVEGKWSIFVQCLFINKSFSVLYLLHQCVSLVEEVQIVKLTAAVSVGTEFVHHPVMDAQITAILEDKMLATTATLVS